MVRILIFSCHLILQSVIWNGDELSILPNELFRKIALTKKAAPDKIMWVDCSHAS